jgi:glycine/D-amino acid oxidase-like deaminating enzyme
VVIGSGALGASIAFHLARAGKQVALVDKHALGSQTSPRAAGLTSQARGTDLMTALAARAVRKIEAFARETGEPLVFYQPGALKIARTPEHVEQLRSELERSRRVSTGLEAISPSDARAMNPFLETAGILAVNFSPTDLYLEPSQIPHGYARAAERVGAQMLPHTLVTGIVLRGDALVGVETEHGTIRCETVVDAAGAWLRAVAALAGARVPMIPTRHQLLITEPIDGVDPMQPITRIIDANVYVRPDAGGLMLGGYEADPVQYDPAALPPRFDIADLDLDLQVLRRRAVDRTRDRRNPGGVDHRREAADRPVSAGAGARGRPRRGGAASGLPASLRPSLLGEGAGSLTLCAPCWGRAEDLSGGVRSCHSVSLYWQD